MPNPLFEKYGMNQTSNMNPMVQQLIGFKNGLQYDPQQRVQELLNSGAMTQDQCNSLVQKGQMFLSQFGSMLPKI